MTPGRNFVLSLLTAACLILPFDAIASEKPLKIDASAAIGHDNNAHLNAERKSDFFVQEAAGVRYKKQLNSFSRLRFSSDILNVNYFDANEENLTPVGAGAGLDLKISPSTIVELDANFTYFNFPNENLATFFESKGRAGIRQRLARNVEWKGGFSVSGNDFNKREKRSAVSRLSDGDERSDARYAADTEISYLAVKNTLLKAGFVYLWNDSNDQFHDYYDYDAYRIYTGSVFTICPRLNGFVRFTYEGKDYDSRPLVDNVSVFENDDLYGAMAGLFYKLHENVSLGYLYSYRQKNSNEPSEHYSVSISSLGVYCSF